MVNGVGGVCGVVRAVWMGIKEERHEYMISMEDYHTYVPGRAA